jgi:hypothetical protein
VNDLSTHGLFIMDLEHMPGEICGTWLSWWMCGDSNLAKGATEEIDIIENVNDADFSSVTLYAYRKGKCDVKTRPMRCMVLWIQRGATGMRVVVEVAR